MPIWFNCTYCTKKIALKGEYHGKRIELKCPFCGKKLAGRVLARPKVHADSGSEREGHEYDLDMPLPLDDDPSEYTTPPPVENVVSENEPSREAVNQSLLEAAEFEDKAPSSALWAVPDKSEPVRAEDYGLEMAQSTSAEAAPPKTLGTPIDTPNDSASDQSSIAEESEESIDFNVDELANSPMEDVSDWSTPPPENLDLSEVSTSIEEESAPSLLSDDEADFGTGDNDTAPSAKLNAEIEVTKSKIAGLIEQIRIHQKRGDKKANIRQAKKKKLKLQHRHFVLRHVAEEKSHLRTLIAFLGAPLATGGLLLSLEMVALFASLLYQPLAVLGVIVAPLVALLTWRLVFSPIEEIIKTFPVWEPPEDAPTTSPSYMALYFLAFSAAVLPFVICAMRFIAVLGKS